MLRPEHAGFADGMAAVSSVYIIRQRVLGAQRYAGVYETNTDIMRAARVVVLVPGSLIYLRIGITTWHNRAYYYGTTTTVHSLKS